MHHQPETVDHKANNPVKEEGNGHVAKYNKMPRFKQGPKSHMKQKHDHYHYILRQKLLYEQQELNCPQNKIHSYQKMQLPLSRAEKEGDKNNKNLRQG